MAQTFSALAYSNLSGTLLWVTIGLVVAGSLRSQQERAVIDSAARQTAPQQRLATAGHQ